MNRVGLRRSWLATTSVSLCLAVVSCALRLDAAQQRSDGKGAARPQWEEISAALQRHFAAYPDYRPRDIISRSQVESLFEQLHRMGWNIPQQARILAAIPGDSDFIVTQLRTSQGLRFMRRVNGDPMAYDRLDGLSNLYDGHRVVSDVIMGPGGDRLMKYFATPPGGMGLTRQLRNTPGAGDFGKPTGKIYTAEALSEELARQYKAAGPDRSQNP